jgi:hypothetical protein
MSQASSVATAPISSGSNIGITSESLVTIAAIVGVALIVWALIRGKK